MSCSVKGLKSVGFISRVFGKVYSAFDVEGIIYECSDKYQALLDKNKSMYDSLSKKEIECNKYKNKITKLENDYSETIKDLTKEIKELKDRENKASLRFETLANEKVVLEDVIKDSKATIRSLNVEHKKQIENIKKTNLNSQRANSKSIADDLLKADKKQSKEVEKLKKEIESLKAKLEEKRVSKETSIGSNTRTLTCKDIKEARVLREKGSKFTELAKKYGVSVSIISRAVRGETYKECK